VLAGIGFWLLAVAGSVAGKITVQSAGRWFAGLLGTVLIILGLGIYSAPTPPAKPPVTETKVAPLPKQPDQPAPQTLTPPAGPTVTETKVAPPPKQPEQPPLPTSSTPSFDCATHYQPDEIAICKSPRLCYLDRQLEALYHTTLRDRPNQLRKIKEHGLGNVAPA